MSSTTAPAPGNRLPAWLPILIGLAVAASCLVLAWSHGGLVTGKASDGFNPVYAFSGLAIGILVGLTGIGGGSLMTPLLVLLFGLHPSTAVGTDLLYASATKSVGTMVHGANRTIDWRVTGRLALGSVPATILTVGLLYVLRDNEGSSSKLISTVLGFALLLTAVTLFFRHKLFELAQRRSFVLSPARAQTLTIVLGAALGVLITLSSVGAGAIGVTVLIFLYPDMPLSRIVGSDIAHAVPLTLIAGAGHLALGTVNLPLMESLLVGSIPGIILGSHFAARASDRILRPILAGTLVLVGGRLVF
ncbi:sulfite exporter TauE/SafE family protein [Sphingomonas sp. BIUV-7]|uniref:Probable membrane transporter protein n=1 Tax=Sphingomonas natans TaxID=3063330 RepID=A0ABT8Y9K8_9SPHN|nr:sulfite exporter TauE/SafE family protein [Sphingomonas sp. BIUV-7]MDO6415021.1 sulfite exporter TauE/SafE family protein [Sphingomonas sp. BIUV-7]